jgi:hypothetical protein
MQTRAPLSMVQVISMVQDLLSKINHVLWLQKLAFGKTVNLF